VNWLQSKLFPEKNAMLTEHFVTYEELNDVICRSVIYYLLIDKNWEYIDMIYA
jgi:hypothetical protein